MEQCQGVEQSRVFRRITRVIGVMTVIETRKLHLFLFKCSTEALQVIGCACVWNTDNILNGY